MYPHKFSVFTAPIAERFGLDPAVVNELARVYFQDVVQKELSTQDTHLAVDVPGLGYFYVKRKALERRIRRTSEIIERFRPAEKGYRMQVRMRLESELPHLQKLLALLLSEKEREKSIRQKRYEHLPKPVSEPQSDSGGNQEQTLPT